LYSRRKVATPKIASLAARHRFDVETRVLGKTLLEILGKLEI
jgi:hypothetical protein